MRQETWLKIGSVLIYLFVPAFVIRIFCSFLDVLFLVEIPSWLSVTVAVFFSALCTLIGTLNISDCDNYILKQKTKQ
jgi:hypothetical protein